MVEFSPFYFTCLICFGVIAFQLILIKVQEFYGPRYIIPDFLLPPKYDYFRQIKNLEEELKPPKKEEKTTKLSIEPPSPSKNPEEPTDTPTDQNETIEESTMRNIATETSLQRISPVATESEPGQQKELEDLGEHHSEHDHHDHGEKKLDVDCTCPICLGDLRKKSEIVFDEEIKNKWFVTQLKKRKDQFMKAPCGHCFHIPCLVNWMQIKMVCPVCRQKLPHL